MSEEHTTYLRKSGRSTVANARSDEAVRRAFATGAQVDVLKKNTVGNKSGAAAAAGNLAKLENETEVFKGISY